MFLLAALFSVLACEKSDREQGLGNDCINRSRIEPYVVGDAIRLVYAMYMPYGSGKIVSATIEASIPGGEETWLEHHAFTVDEQGEDLPIVVGNPCVTVGGATTVDFIIDTCAASLRYYYAVPEEARGKDVYFECSVVDNQGRRATFREGPCKVRKMEIFRNIQMSLSMCYLSLENMRAYTGTEAEFLRIPIDLVWTFLSRPANVETGSTFISPIALDKIAPYMTTPPTPPALEYMRPTEKMRPQIIVEKQLAIDQEYADRLIDDIDFETLDLQGGTEYVMGLTARRGLWVETADGKYRTFIYTNGVNTGGCEISAKRYKMFE